MDKSTHHSDIQVVPSPPTLHEPRRKQATSQRNSLCYCGSRKKYKKCCMNKWKQMETNARRVKKEGREYMPVLDDIPDKPVKAVFSEQKVETGLIKSDKYAWMLPQGAQTSAEEFLEIADAAGIPVVDPQS